ncbi:unnamed protein product [Caenorhabditis sp. 36 PRJEB53466]|nr:unnamed protein product [Caenorhabditis sp. 36 PRJEB53466]
MSHSPFFPPPKLTIRGERLRLCRPPSTKQAAQRRAQNAAVVHLNADAEEDDCFHRIPFASLIGTLLCVLGVVLFAIMMSWAFNATAEQTRRSLRINDWPWLDKVQVFFIVIAVLMGLFSLFFLCIGFTATGGTRETMYKDDEARCGGKVACVIAMIFDVLLVIAWLFIISIVSWLCIFYYFFDRLCLDLPGYTDGDCIDLHVFWPLVSSFANSNLRMCGGDVQQFCALTSTAFTWYVIGWVGCVLIILGILLFFGIHASNYAHIGNANRYVELGNLRMVDHRDSGDDRLGRGRLPEKFEVQSTQWSDSRANYSMRTTTSRQAEHMSDSVSQFDNRRDKRKPVF